MASALQIWVERRSIAFQGGQLRPARGGGAPLRVGGHRVAEVGERPKLLGRELDEVEDLVSGERPVGDQGYAPGQLDPGRRFPQVGDAQPSRRPQLASGAEALPGKSLGEHELRLRRSLPGFELESLHRVSRLEGLEAIKSDCAPLPGRSRTPSLPGRLEATDSAGPEHLVVSHDLDVAVLGNLPLEDPAAGQGAQLRALDPDQHPGLALSDKPVPSLCHPRSVADEN
jgi:hypothetical protein